MISSIGCGNRSTRRRGIGCPRVDHDWRSWTRRPTPPDRAGSPRPRSDPPSGVLRRTCDAAGGGASWLRSPSSRDPRWFLARVPRTSSMIKLRMRRRARRRCLRPQRVRPVLCGTRRQPIHRQPAINDHSPTLKRFARQPAVVARRGQQAAAGARHPPGRPPPRTRSRSVAEATSVPRVRAKRGHVAAAQPSGTQQAMEPSPGSCARPVRCRTAGRRRRQPPPDRPGRGRGFRR